MTNNNDYTIINKRTLSISAVFLLFVIIIKIILASYAFVRQDIRLSSIILALVFISMTFFILTISYQNGFKYNKTDLIVFHSWFGFTKFRIRIKDIASIRHVSSVNGRSYIAIELYNKKEKYYSCVFLKETLLDAMVSEINKYILKNYLNEDTAQSNGNKYFKCKKIHLKPETAIYGYILFFFYILYILCGIIWWNIIVNLYDGGFLFFYLLVGILLPILIYKNKMLKTAYNVYLNDCVITITNESTGYKKTIPFEAIRKIRYANGLEIELNIGQKLHYKICGNQARKRLGIEKIIGEFERFKKMTRQTTENKQIK